MSARTRPIVAIDGPAGCGKSTVAQILSRRLGLLYVDTGAMYRAVALKADRADALGSDDRIADLARTSRIEFSKGAHDEVRVFLDDEDVTHAIRTPRIDKIVSPVSTVPEVRKRMVELQREIGADGGIIMEGRDIQTVVFPDAEVKIFLTASIGERARRRFKQLQSKGVRHNFEAVQREINERDCRDTTRADSPLLAAPDAVTILTDALSIDEVVERIEGIVRKSISQNKDVVTQPNN